jgi:hypothetical protein
MGISLELVWVMPLSGVSLAPVVRGRRRPGVTRC